MGNTPAGRHLQDIYRFARVGLDTSRRRATERRRHHWNGRQPPSEASQASCLDLRAAPKRGLCGGDCGGRAATGGVLWPGLAAL